MTERDDAMLKRFRLEHPELDDIPDEPLRRTLVFASWQFNAAVRDLGRELLRTPPISWIVTADGVERHWWLFYVLSFPLMLWALWLGDPGWMVFILIVVGYGWWRRHVSRGAG